MWTEFSYFKEQSYTQNFEEHSLIGDFINATRITDTDTDTIGAVLGGLLGACYDLPQELNGWVDDFGYIRALEKELRSGSHGSLDTGELSGKKFKEAVGRAQIGDSIFNTCLGSMVVSDIIEYPVNDSKYCEVYVCTTVGGQTLNIRFYRQY